jgi:hypothetical protein
VFSNVCGGPLFLEGLHRRIWGPTLQRAGLRHHNHYQTRHTFATLMLSQGEEIAWVAHMMGHVNTRMIVERYYQYIPRRTRQDGDRFTTAFEAARTRQPSVDYPERIAGICTPPQLTDIAYAPSKNRRGFSTVIWWMSWSEAPSSLRRGSTRREMNV